MDKLECPIFHDFDGACCRDGNCNFQKEVHVIPLDNKELAENLAAHHSTLAFLLLMMIVGFGGLFAAFNYEADLRRQALIHQEEISLR